jgi:hypothetical protein
MLLKLLLILTYSTIIAVGAILVAVLLTVLNNIIVNYIRGEYDDE